MRITLLAKPFLLDEVTRPRGRKWAADSSAVARAPEWGPAHRCSSIQLCLRRELGQSTGQLFFIKFWFSAVSRVNICSVVTVNYTTVDSRYCLNVEVARKSSVVENWGVRCSQITGLNLRLQICKYICCAGHPLVARFHNHNLHFIPYTHAWISALKRHWKWWWLTWGI